jgi:hypothetical protein
MDLTKTMLVAAVGGMLMGCGGSTPPAASPGDPAAAVAPAAGTPASTAAKHACKTLNDCKGQGGCKTDKHACKTLNDCKGQGGCKSA